jgi:hypothetical protein
LRAADLLPVLDTFLEAVKRTRRERALAKIVRTGEKQIAAAFRAQGAAIVREISKSRLSEAAAAPPPPSPPPSDAARLLDDWGRLFTIAELETLAAFVSPIQGVAQAALEAGIRVTLADLHTDIAFDLAHPRAVAWLEDYGARRVTMINETTRETIKGLVTKGVDEGWSYDKTAEAISDRFREFSVGKPQLHIESRAHLVAVTEAGESYEAAGHMVAEELAAAGLAMEHFWLTVGDDRVSDGCRVNTAVGWIALAQPFPSGHMHPLRFPGCRCTGLTRRKPDEEPNA